MRKTISILAVLFLGLVGVSSAMAATDTCSSVAGNRIANCGFETGDLTGWTDNGFYDTVNSTSTSPLVKVNSGTYAAEIGGFGSDESLSQTFATVVGGIYTIQFALANEGGAPNDLKVIFDGVTLLSQSNAAAGGYLIYSYTAAATLANSTLSFLARNDEYSFDLDSVSVVGPVPEPSSLVLLGTGALGLVNVVRRRIKG